MFDPLKYKERLSKMTNERLLDEHRSIVRDMEAKGIGMWNTSDPNVQALQILEQFILRKMK